MNHLKMTATAALPANDMVAFCEAVREACPGVEVKLEVVTPERPSRSAGPGVSLTTPAFLDLLRPIVAAEGTRAFAARVGINVATVSQVVNGHLAPTEAIANAIGYVRQTTFIKIITGQA